MQYNTENPRFIMTVGAYSETFNDAPESLPIGIYDRQEKAMVITVGDGYQNLICLEVADSAPFTFMHDWLNQLNNSELESESIPTTI